MPATAGPTLFDAFDVSRDTRQTIQQYARRLKTYDYSETVKRASTMKLSRGGDDAAVIMLRGKMFESRRAEFVARTLDGVVPQLKAIFDRSPAQDVLVREFAPLLSALLDAKNDTDRFYLLKALLAKSFDRKIGLKKNHESGLIEFSPPKPYQSPHDGTNVLRDAALSRLAAQSEKLE